MTSLVAHPLRSSRLTARYPGRPAPDRLSRACLLWVTLVVLLGGLDL